MSDVTASPAPGSSHCGFSNISDTDLDPFSTVKPSKLSGIGTGTDLGMTGRGAGNQTMSPAMTRHRGEWAYSQHKRNRLLCGTVNLLSLKA
jgi:hypothetical protein